jgi:outer membrane protein
MLPRSLARNASRLAASASLLLASTLSTLPAHAEGTVAVVDLQGAVMQTEDGMRAQATLKKLFDRRQQDLDAKQVQLQRVRVDIEKQAKFLSREAITKRMETWQRDMLQLQTTFVDYNKELQKKQGELTQPIVKRMVGIVERIAKQNGYGVVIDRAAAPYARPDLDLTDRVVQMYNGGGGGDAPPKDEPKKD